MIREVRQCTPEQAIFKTCAIETVAPSSQIVCSRRDFDRRIRTDSSFRREIAGFSSFSLYHTQIGATPEGYSVPLFSYNSHGRCVYAELRPGVFRVAIGHDYYYGRFEHLLRLNRRDYGSAAATIDFIMRQPYAPENYKMLEGDLIDDLRSVARDLRSHRISMRGAISGLTEEIKIFFQQKNT